MAERFPALEDQHMRFIRARQIFLLSVELVQTSCGYGVPRYRL